MTLESQQSTAEQSEVEPPTVHGRDRLTRPAPSPAHGWQREVVYFLLPDRFSDDRLDRPLLDPEHLQHTPPGDQYPYQEWRWDLWAISGGNRFQGGTLRGITSRLDDYLVPLGVTVLWLGPVWKQRVAGVDVNLAGDGTDDDVFRGAQTGVRAGAAALRAADVVWPRDDYHGYSVQDFRDVDPRFGSKKDLITLIEEAHRRGIRVILDVVINHSGVNFSYDVPTLNPLRPPFGRNDGPPPDKDHRYRFGAWLDRANKPLQVVLGADGKPLPGELGEDDGVWPESLQDENFYNRKGEGSYGSPDIVDGDVESLVSDWRNRDFRYEGDPHDGAFEADPVRKAMVEIWTEWMTETDCDGFRIDTFKHVPKPAAARFVECVLDHAATKLGKQDFLLIAEVAGPDAWGASYLSIPNLRVLELGHRRWALRALAGGDRATPPADVLTPIRTRLDGRSDPSVPTEARDDLTRVTDADLADRTVTTIDDHDGVGLPAGTRLARQYGTASVVPAAALLLFGPGIPCVYYGTEQALRGPQDELGWLNPYWGARADRFLREAMFGPEHPRCAGAAGHPGAAGKPFDDPSLLDLTMPGFGPMGTSGFHVFKKNSEWYGAIACLTELRERCPVLADGRISILSGRVDDGAFGPPLPPNIVAWQRTDRDSTAVIVLNTARDGSTPLRDITVLLDPSTTMDEFTWETQQPATIEDLPKKVPAAMREQSRLRCLRVGQIPAGQVRVYTSQR